MVRTKEIIIPMGDSGFDLAFVATDASGNNFDLTGYTLRFLVWTFDIPATLLVSGSCTIDPGDNWKCSYTVASGDFDTEGEFEGELEITQAGRVESFRRIRVIVRESG